MKKITEKTLVPISLVLAIGGGVYKFSEQSFATDQTTKDVAALRESLRESQEKVSDQLEQQSQILGDVRVQVSGINARLDSLTEYMRATRLETRRLRTRED